MNLQLDVQRDHQLCSFRLSWGQEQRLSATLPYPESLTAQYQAWCEAYLSFYRKLASGELLEEEPSPAELRGRIEESGSLSSAEDWRFQLVQVEAYLLAEFHRWLYSAQLIEIRQQIVWVARDYWEQAPTIAVASNGVNLFLTCSPIELERLPWEAWEIGTEFAATGSIRIIRTPLNMPMKPGSRGGKRRQGRARILAILGDDTGLDFQADRTAVRSLRRLADVQFVGWQPEQTTCQVITQIKAAIADERGWDMLFFAGHSNETKMTGGELGIAPGVSIAIHEIESQLLIAKELGLQVAIFNSCRGLSIAEALIRLGFGQVVVMREPIHNRVAQEFLLQLLQGLVQHRDVHDSLIAARQFLRLEKNHTYPSAYLVPSLFCHPGATLYQIAPLRWQQRLLNSLPTRWEAIALATCLVLSGIPPIHDLLINGRIGMQAIYRDITAQLPLEDPSIALIQIDTESINRDGITPINPLNRSYLAKIVQRLEELDAEVIGVDVLLNDSQSFPVTGDADLGKAVWEAVAQTNTWFIFAAVLEPSNGSGVNEATDMAELGVKEATGIADQAWSLQGYIDADPYSVMLPSPGDNCRIFCPFAYLMSLVYTAQQELPTASLPQPRLNRTENLRTQLLDVIDRQQSQTDKLAAVMGSHFTLLSTWAYNLFGQQWLEPIIDFSIPPNAVYNRISAWKLLDPSGSNEFSNLPQQIVLIAAGDDYRMGLKGQGDRFAVPLAMYYWTQQSWLTGGESLAYMTHHLLTQRLVVPIPDFCMIGIAAALGKVTVLILKQHQRQHRWSRQHRLQVIAGLAGATVAYGVIGLQLYISAAILFPWVFPSAVFWMYVVSAIRRKN